MSWRGTELSADVSSSPKVRRASVHSDYVLYRSTFSRKFVEFANLKVINYSDKL